VGIRAQANLVNLVKSVQLKKLLEEGCLLLNTLMIARCFRCSDDPPWCTISYGVPLLVDSWSTVCSSIRKRLSMMLVGKDTAVGGGGRFGRLDS